MRCIFDKCHKLSRVFDIPVVRQRGRSGASLSGRGTTDNDDEDDDGVTADFRIGEGRV